MDTTSLFYFSELTRDMNMTKTAGRLFISQQTLSNHILRLEQQLGCRLFDRKPALALTYAGEQALLSAKRILSEQEDLQALMSDISGQEKGVIRFGASNARLNICAPYLLSRFREEYPGVNFVLTDNITVNLEPMVLNNELDYAIILSESKSPELQSVWLTSDPLYLCVSDTLLQEYCPELGEETLRRYEKEGTCLAPFRNLPFCMLYNRMGQLIQNCCREEGLTPVIRYSASYVHIGISIAFQRLAASFVCDVSLLNYHRDVPPDIRMFPLLSHGKQLTQEMYLIRNRNRYLPRFATAFEELVRSGFAEGGVLYDMIAARRLQAAKNGTSDGGVI